MKKYIAVFVSCASKKEATKIARKLLEEKLIACANIIPGASSYFWWRGKIDKAEEALLAAKTIKRNFRKIEKRIKALHSYELPEIIGLPIIEGESGYLKWIDESVET